MAEIKSELGLGNSILKAQYSHHKSSLQRFVALLTTALFCSLVFGQSAMAASPSSGLAPYSGKWVYVDFWASWCAPCQASFPFMNKLQSQLQKQNFTVVAVNVDEQTSDAKTFLNNNAANFPVIFDNQGKLPEEFGVQAMPTSFLLNPQGEIVWKHQGFLPKDSAHIKQAIQQKMQGT